MSDHSPPAAADPAAPRDSLEALVRREPHNAIAAWLLIGIVVAAAGESALGGDLLWATFALVVGVLAAFPAVAGRRLTAALPWPIVALAALPVLGRALATVPVTGTVGTYLSVAALALVLAVELDAYTAVRMTPAFAVGFVVIATVAAAGVWAVARWSVLPLLGERFAVTLPALMWEFVASSLAGIGAGIVFEGYVRRWLCRRDRRAPTSDASRDSRSTDRAATGRSDRPMESTAGRDEAEEAADR